MVCASNMNRSMDAHNLLKAEGLDVESYGVGTQGTLRDEKPNPPGHHQRGPFARSRAPGADSRGTPFPFPFPPSRAAVKIPGPSAREPNVYPFGTPYHEIYNELKFKDQALYERNGMLRLLERNLKVKLAPERWQENTTKFFDVVLTFDDVVFDKLMEDVRGREQKQMKSFLVVNLKVKDTPTEAGKASPLALQLCRKIQESEDWEDDIGRSSRTSARRREGRPFTPCASTEQVSGSSSWAKIMYKLFSSPQPASLYVHDLDLPVL